MSRRSVTRRAQFLVVAVVALLSARATALADVLDVGNQRQLFIDERFFGGSKNVRLVVHPPAKTGEFNIKEDRPWEDGIGVYNSVLEVNGTYHLWYESGHAICYAVSKDGIKWEKPALGLTDDPAGKGSNVVLGYGAGGIDHLGEAGMVFIDPNAPPEEKFRMTVREPEAPIIDPKNPAGVGIYSSPDGIHWKLTHPHLLTFNQPDGKQHLDTQNIIFWDARFKKYVAYMRRNVRKGGRPRFRTVVRSESPKLGGFEEAQVAPIVLAPDEHDARFGVPDLVDYYTSGVIVYPWAQDAYVMFPTVYFHYTAGQLSEFPAKQVPANAGPLDTQFAASRDGVKWNRFGREVFVGLGLKGTFDSRIARVFYGMVPSPDRTQIYIYYTGSDHLHGWPHEEKTLSIRHKTQRPPMDPETEKKEKLRAEKSRKLLEDAGLQPTLKTSAISRLVLRMDGFVSARADYTGGEFTTPPLTFAGSELAINVDTSATGHLQCELLDEQDQPIKGYALADCDVVHSANEINRVVSWKKNKDLSKLAGKTIRVRFVLRATDVYAFQFR